jgi:hypothetical protein
MNVHKRPLFLKLTPNPRQQREGNQRTIPRLDRVRDISRKPAPI